MWWQARSTSRFWRCLRPAFFSRAVGRGVFPSVAATWLAFETFHAPLFAEDRASVMANGLPDASRSSTVYMWGKRAAIPVQSGDRGEGDVRNPTEIKWFRLHAEEYGCQWRQLAFGPTFGVARTDTGSLYMWGGGRRSGTPRALRLHSEPLTLFRDVQCSEATVWAVTADGRVAVWERVVDTLMEGADLEGRILGHIEPVHEMAVGCSHAAFLTVDHHVYCLGSNRYGQCGVDPMDQQTVPVCREVILPRLAGAVLHVACGRHHTVALTESGQCYSWGDDSKIQLGLGDTRSNFGDERPYEKSMSSSASKPPPAPSTATTKYGEFQPHFQWRPTPTQQIPLEFQRQVHGTPYPPPDGVLCGHEFTALIVRDSPDWYPLEEETCRVFSCGENMQGQCGRSLQSMQQTFAAVKLPRNSKIDSISCGADHCVTVLRRKDTPRKREVWSWGSNSNGQAGGNCTGSVCPAARLRLPREVRVEAAWCGSRNSAAICSQRAPKPRASPDSEACATTAPVPDTADV